jgi:hypothetical protein
MGQRAPALRHFEDLRALLKEEPDAAPEEETTALAEALRGGEEMEGAAQAPRAGLRVEAAPLPLPNGAYVVMGLHEPPGGARRTEFNLNGGIHGAGVLSFLR